MPGVETLARRARPAPNLCPECADAAWITVARTGSVEAPGADHHKQPHNLPYAIMSEAVNRNLPAVRYYCARYRRKPEYRSGCARCQANGVPANQTAEWRKTGAIDSWK